MRAGSSRPAFTISIIFFQIIVMFLSGCTGGVTETLGPDLVEKMPGSTATLELLPDLVTRETWVTSGEGEDCVIPDHPQYMIHIEITNRGEADSGAFHVLINEDREEFIPGLKQGESIILELSIIQEDLRIQVDSREEVVERSESDNIHAMEMDFQAIPACTPIPDKASPPQFSVVSLLPAGVPVHISHIQMFGDNLGWAIGGQDASVQHVLRTEDGGHAWLDVTPPEIITNDDVSFMRATSFFMDVEESWISFQSDPHGQPGITWQTQDAGHSWKSSIKWLSGVVGSTSSWPIFDFVDDETGWMLINHFVGANTYKAELFRTQDSGRTWEQIQGSETHPWVVGSVAGIDFIDALHGILTSTNPLKAEVYVYWTDDGGTSWSEQKLSAPDTNEDLFNLLPCGVSVPTYSSSHTSLLSVYCYNEDGLAVPYLYRTLDAGMTWKAYPLPGKFRGVSIDIVDSDLIFVLGRKINGSGEENVEESGELYKSVDGGKDWSEVAVLEGYGAIHFIDEQSGWAMISHQEGTSLLHSDDGGLSWEDLQPHTIADEGETRSVVAPGGIVLPEDLVPLTFGNIDEIQLLDLQVPSQASDLAFSPDGKALILAREDGWIIQWPIKTLSYPLAAHRHTGSIIDVAAAVDGAVIASASENGTIWVWFLESPIQFSIEKGIAGISSLALSPNGNTLAVGLDDGSVEYWDLSAGTGQVLDTIAGNIGQRLQVVYSSDGRELAVGSSAGDVTIWDSTTGEPLSQWKGHTAAVDRMAYAPSGLSLATLSEEGSLKIWDLASPGDNIILVEDAVKFRSMSYSPDGALLAAGSENGKLYVWDVNSGEVMRILQNTTSPILSVTFSPSGDVIASSSQDGFIRFWGVQTSMD